jgi:hypothetical protein
MRVRPIPASWLAALIISAFSISSVGWAGPKDGGKSAGDDDGDRAVKQKVDGAKGKGGKGADADERVSALERQVRDLTLLVKQQMAGGKTQPDKNAPSAKAVWKKGDPEGDKSNPKQHAIDKTAKAKFEPKESKDDQRGGKGEVQLVKGKDGQLLVPLSALPPGLQKKFLAAAQGGPEDQGAWKKQGVKEGDKGDGDQPKFNKFKKNAGDEDDERPKGKEK